MPGDPISDGLDLVIQGGDGTNNQEYPDDIDPGDATATVIWKYDANRNGAIRADTGTYKVVYLGFGFEAINNADDRRDVMQQSVEWLVEPAVPGGAVTNDAPLLLGKTAGGRKLLFSWGDSCLTSDIDYAVYGGILGNFGNHISLVCSTDGETELEVEIGLGNRYYLVVPASPTREGSYGTSSDGFERAQGADACHMQEIGDCS